MITLNIDLSEAEQKALAHEIEDIEAWLTNAVKEKARKLVDRFSESSMRKGVNDIGERYLSDEDISSLGNQIGFVPNLRDIPDALKQQIILKAKIPDTNRVNEFMDRKERGA